MAFIQLIIVHYLVSSMFRNLIPGLLVRPKTQIRKPEEQNQTIELLYQDN